MAKRQTIGVYIAPTDLDILAWFNMMRENNLPISKWVAGLLMAEKLGDKLDIGAVCLAVAEPQATAVTSPTEAPTVKHAKPPVGLLFGSGNTQSKTQGFNEPMREKLKWDYGWHIRGSDGEFVVGSVVNISIARQELRLLLNDLRKDGHMLAPYVKALIRESLRHADTQKPPEDAAIARIFSRFILATSKLKQANNQQEQPPEVPAPPRPPEPSVKINPLSTQPALSVLPTPVKRRSPLLDNI